MLAHPAGRAGQGLGHRHDLHLRRPHRRHLVARARPAHPRRDRPRRPLPGRRPRRRGRRRRRPRPPTPSWPARPSSRPRPASSSCWPSPATLDGEPRAITAPGQVLREGRPAARDRHHPPVVHPQRRPRRRPARRAARPGASELHWHPTLHAARYENWVDGPQRRLADLAASASSACRSRSGTAVDDDGELDYDGALVPDEDRLPVDPSSRRPRRLRRGPARPAGRLRRRPRRHGHLGHLVAHPADRLRLGGRPRPVRPDVPDGPAPAGPRHHPHLAVLHRACAAHLEHGHAAVDQRRHLRLDPRPRPQEDVQVEGQRRHPDGAARAVRLRRGALLGRQRPARHRHRLRRGRR